MESWSSGQRPPPPQHLPGGLHRHPFPKVITIPTIREPSPPIPSAKGVIILPEQSARESQCTGCPHLSACGQSPERRSKRQRPRALWKRTAELGGSFSEPSIHLAGISQHRKKTTCKGGERCYPRTPGGRSLRHDSSEGVRKVLGKASLTALTPTLEKWLL